MTSIRTRSALQAAIDAGMQPAYLFFWGHRPAAGGKVGASCMSQWYAAGFEHEGAYYPTAEHFMMAGKARLFGDEDAVAQIIAAPGPDKVKAIGRRVKNYDDAAWSRERFAIVVAGNLAKFSQNAGLKAFLFGTGEKILVEASPVDAIWGIGLAQDDPAAAKPHEWRGENLLGFALMELRSLLRQS
jgi:ribA/ribD-fused uncharacterized protein